ncbi:YGGT family protein [Candidatus Portiera aleyrodidarum]|uniref:YGGT family protein n=1 Tax=Candidatus Portiera aleyrodidarum TV TaxID=1297582 RepID=A0A8D4BPM5_9GAMM|nr:YggT family protein [Candidatus Portiera aleyrodidarum]AGI27015.1 YGGT family protein [Candidatus Portiera aleyrodidarum TV]CEI58969.1 YGGT family protein [Candidatus Portiera aleyrodidarum]
MENIGLSLINTLFNLYTFMLMLRFALNISYADKNNPITQNIIKFTSFIVNPVKNFIKSIGGFDLATFISAIFIKTFSISIIYLIYINNIPPIINVFIGSIASVLNILIRLYFFALIIMTIISWILNNSDHPGLLLIIQITEPIMLLLRKLIPHIGIIDISPIAAFIIINLIDNIIICPLINLASLPSSILVGY